MKKSSLCIFLAGALLASSCTSLESGLYGGATFGSILGSAIGGLSDGPRGSDVGTIVGMVGGAVVGAAIGNAGEKSREQRMQERRTRMQERRCEVAAADMEGIDYGQAGLERSGFDPTMSGDDRIADFDAPAATDGYTPLTGTAMESGTDAVPTAGALNEAVTIRNARFVDGNRDNILSSNEVGRVVFEVVNTSDRMLYGITPVVYEVSGNKRIYISEPIHVERLAPGKGIRYTATVKSARMKNGEATFVLNVMQGNKRMAWAQQITVPTRR